eukprot:CAMPEP_0198600232 /NCGR_PEP_ID=MMETSP1462-20131121/147993_1 /TAXON_ID=1333877 /ORGANISM="Brandtodinium nutriculum, Strain RCC3387" /LENGTH=157 /DNA_ID=CAMNT_0044331939 /DNA_START=9 /DNA_END=478 /DNA_ORIENTATION=-
MAGPDLRQHRTCARYESCTVQNVTGTALEDGDRLMVLESCRTGGGVTETPTILVDYYTRGVVGFPVNGGLHGLSLPATEDGSSFSWGPSSLDTAGKYKMCWCAKIYADAGGCSKSEDFKVEVGILTVYGFATHNTRTCFSGQPCELERLVGYPLYDG